jgi:FixJ family two-component response regulator
LTTGNIGPLTPAEVRDAGFRDLLAKPMEVRVLGEAVQRALGQNGAAKRERSAG